MEQRERVAHSPFQPDWIAYVKHTFLAMMLFVGLYAAVFALAWASHFVWGIGFTPASFVVLFAIFLICILVLLGIADPRRISKASGVDPDAE